MNECVDLPDRMVVQARVRLTPDESTTTQLLCDAFLPMHRCVSGSIQAQIEFPDKILISRFYILRWKLYIHFSGHTGVEEGSAHIIQHDALLAFTMSRGLGQQVSESLDRRSGCKHVRVHPIVELLCHNSGPDQRVILVHLIDIDPSEFYDLLAYRLRLVDLAPNAHLADILNLQFPGFSDHILWQCGPRDIVISIAHSILHGQHQELMLEHLLIF